MPIKFPSFADTRCEFLTVCGGLTTDDSDVLDKLADSATLESRYKREGRVGYVLLALGGSDGKTVHADLAPHKYFGDSPPSPKDKISDVRARLEELAGQEIDVSIQGLSYYAQDELPLPIRPFLEMDSSIGDVAIKMTGATFEVTGTPVHRIEWWITKRRSEIGVRLTADTVLTIDDSYFDRCLEMLSPVFDALTAGVDHDHET